MSYVLNAHAISTAVNYCGTTVPIPYLIVFNSDAPVELRMKTHFNGQRRGFKFIFERFIVIIITIFIIILGLYINIQPQNFKYVHNLKSS